MIHIARKPLSRRIFLRTAGAALALPFLDAMRPVFGKDTAAPPRRMIAICTNLGILERHFFPLETGRDFTLTPYLETLVDFRDHFTVVSGTSHPDVAGGHSAEWTFLSAAPRPGTTAFRNSISLDQFAAERIGHETRVHSLALSVAKGGSQSLSVNASGVMLPSERSPAQLFKALFVDGDDASVARQVENLRTGRSVLDLVSERATELKKNLGGVDRDRIDQYFTSVREVERRLQLSEQWEKKTKPKVNVPPPTDGEYLIEQIAPMYDLAHLALSTDSTRLITFLIRLDGFAGHTPGVTSESHNLSHHINRPDALAQLKNLETAEFKQLATFLGKLTSTSEPGATLLDRTQVLYGSSLGNANSHDNKNLPIVLAGGGYKHGQHLAFDRKQNHPLPNLFVTMLQRLGLETDKFASSTGTLPGLELA